MLIFQMKKTVIAYLFLVAILFLSACNNSQSETQTEKQPLMPEKKFATSGTANLLPPLFDETSITRDYLNVYQGLKWKNGLGDWVDAEGTPQGKTAWASANIDANERPTKILLDVTNLIKEQQEKSNQLIVLKATTPIKISSREGKYPPLLLLEFEDNSKPITLKPRLDSTIAISTHKNINSDMLAVSSNDETSFLQFKLPNQNIRKAVLELWPIKIYGRGLIQVFNLDYSQNSSKVISGIANSKTSFAELKSHPDVVFVDTFRDEKIKSEWFLQDKLSPGHLVNGYLTGEIFPKKNHSTVNRRFFFKKNLGFEPSEMYFRYSLRFHKDFVFSTQGGKLPGLAGTYNTCGWGSRKPSETCNGWSARMSFGIPIKTGPYKDMIPIGTYLYHLDQQGYYGDGEKWQAFCSLGEWCELEQYVRLNTPGNNDGILRGFHNGKLVYERKNIRFRNLEKIKIEDAWLLVYHGGTGFPTSPIHADIDNVVISKSYIGTLKKNNVNTEIRIHSSSQEPHSNDSDHLAKSTFSSIKSTTKFKKNSRLNKIPENTVIDLRTFNCTNPEGDNENCKKVTDYSGMVYDQNHHQILMFGGGHSTTFTDSIFIFDFNSLSWKEDYIPTPCTLKFMNKGNYLDNASWDKGPFGPYPRPISRHTYDQLAVATGLSELILLAGPNGYSLSCPPNSKTWVSKLQSNPKIAHYDLIKKIWKFSKTAETDSQPYYSQNEYTATEYDPISGMVILLGRYGLYSYNPFSHIKKRLLDFSSGKIPEDLGYANELVYYPPKDKMYYFNRNSKSVWEVNLDRDNIALSTVKKLNINGAYPSHPEPGYAYDGINEVIGGAVYNNKFYIFNPKTNTWTHQTVSGGEPGSMEFHAIAYDPIDNVFIFLTKGFNSWAYRYK